MDRQELTFVGGYMQKLQERRWPENEDLYGACPEDASGPGGSRQPLLEKRYKYHSTSAQVGGSGTERVAQLRCSTSFNLPLLSFAFSLTLFSLLSIFPLLVQMWSRLALAGPLSSQNPEPPWQN